MTHAPGKSSLIRIFIISIACSSAASIILFFLSEAYVINQAEENIQNLLLSHNGIHHYVQQVMLPALYEYKEQHKIPQEFYAPELFSSSFIVRNQHKFYNQELKDSGLPQLYYKLAAKNPRNPVNRADALEEQLIERFNNNRKLKKYREVVEINGEKYLYFAIPFLENQKRCLICHGKREDAPLALQEKYQGEGGFNEKPGYIRAITSIRAPLAKKYHILYVIVPSLAVGIFSLALLFLFNTRLRSRVRQDTKSLQNEIREKEEFAAQLKENENYLKSIQTSMQVGLLLVDKKTYKITDINNAALELVGATREEVIGKKCFSYLCPAQEGECPINDKKQTIDKSERELISSKGDKIPILKSATDVTIKNRTYILETFIDISEKKRNQQMIAESERKLRSFFESTSSIPWELDLQTQKFTLMGVQIEKILGYPVASWTDLDVWKKRMHPDYRKKVANFFTAGSRQGTDQDFIYQAIHQDGSYRWIRDVVSVVAGEEGPQKLVGFMQDITTQKELEQEKEKLEARLNQSQKLEAIGTLAGGIAHDFNNILSVILGYAEIAKDDTCLSPAVAADLERIIAAGQRARDLVQQILAFSRQSQKKKIPMNPSPVVKELIKMLHASIPTTIEIKENILPDCGLIDADPTQLHQVIMNICTNAFHAMEAKGGTMTIELKPAKSIPEEVKSSADAEADSFIELTVSDTGDGIAPEIADKIFDPFFTTKEQGKGTGLGLATSYGIIKDYGGAITVDSEVGLGTTFHIYLPKSTSTDSREAAAFSAEIPLGTGRVLFVDDEELLVELGREMLNRLGYTVTAVHTSTEAWELFQDHPDQFDLVMTDQTMPGMTGLELADRMLQIRPDIPIILCTGYSSRVDPNQVRDRGIKALAFKPLSMDKMANLIHNILSNGAAMHDSCSGSPASLTT